MTNFHRSGHSHALVSWFSSLLLCLCLILSGCGGGGGSQSSSSSPPPPPPPDFTLSLSPSSVTIAAGGSATTSLLASGQNGFSSQVAVQFSGVPPGLTVSPANITLTPGTAQQVTLSAQAGTGATTATITFSGTSGSLSHAAKLGVSVTAINPGPLSTRTDYVRSDAVTEYFLWVNSHWVTYNQPTSRFFVTDPLSNSVFVYDSTTEKEIASISVPGAYGIDQTPDGSTLYVGTLVGDVYTLDPVAMKVTHRYLAAGIGPYGYGGLIALPLASGKVALLGEAGGLPSIDGSSSFAIWNPTDNSIAIYGTPDYNLFNSPGVPMSPICGDTNSTFPIFGFALTADRSSVLVGDGPMLCEMNASTGQYQISAVYGSGKITPSPDGRYLASFSPPTTVTLYDPHTLNQVAQFNVPGTDSGDMNLAFSADSQTLFVSSASVVYAYNVATQQQIGWLPNIVVEPSSGGQAVAAILNPIYEVEDGTGLLVGPVEEGLGFLDTTQMRTGPVGSTFLNSSLDPGTGPVSGGTDSTWTLSSTIVGQPSRVYFGKNPATSFLIGSTGDLDVTAPPGNPGTVNTFLFMDDGGMQLVPDAFSYGPTIVEVTPNMATADGGGAGVIYGYGFSTSFNNTPPAGLSVTVGGTPATITGFISVAYQGNPHPFPLQAIYYTIPAGSGSADVTVTAGSGSATAKGAVTYPPAAKQYPLPGAVLAQGIYDPLRNVYYFSDVNKIQVFSLAQGQWLTPIPVPAATTTSHRLWGISLSPDGSKLAVSDMQTNDIYLLDPSNPSSVQTFPFAPSEPSGIIAHPAGIAVSDSGVVYIAAYIEGGTGFHSFFSLDTGTGTITDYGVDGPQYATPTGVPLDPYLRTALSSDGSRAFFNADGMVFNVDTATDTLFRASTDPNCCYGDYDLALAPNQTQVEASEYLYDSDLNARSSYTLNDREIHHITYVYGAKFSPDGSLLFQPSTNGIDVYDGRLGKLLDRIALPFSLSANYDALVSDGTDNVVLAITGAGDGIAVVNLNSLPEPPPLSYAAARSSRFPMAAARARLVGTASPARRGRARGIRPLKYGARAIPHVVRRIFGTPRAPRIVRH